MKLVRQIIIIMFFVFIGEFLNKFVKIPVPGNIIGMILLMIALLSGKLKLESIEEFGHFLLSHLAIFFIPASVGLITAFGVLKDTWYILLFISVVSTIIVMVTTAFTVKWLRGWIK